MGLLDSLFGRASDGKWSVVAVSEKNLPVPAVGDAFETEDAARAAVKARFPDVSRFQYRFRFEGAAIADAANEIGVLLAEGSNQDGVFIAVVGSSKAKRATKTIRDLLKYMDDLRSGRVAG